MDPISAPVRVRILTLGCKVNQCDAGELARALAARGYVLAGRSQPADAYVVNTCTVTATADAKARKLIRRLAREHPEATLIVTGCLAQRSPEAAALPGVTAVVPGTQEPTLPDLLASLVPPSSPFPLPSSLSRTRAFVKVQDGCDHRCAYCAVPDARGPMVSKPLADALAELRRLAEGGVQEVVLCGIRLGRYGDGASTSLAALLRALRSIGPPRLRLSSIEPMDVTAALLAELADHPTLCHHLHLPLQSGDSAVLQAMGRSYRAEDFARLVAAVRAFWPDAAITTDIMVGFPGETEEQFARTLSFVEGQRFSRVHVFPYSPRSGTPAACLADLPPAVKTARTERMLALAAHLEQAAAEAWVGRPVSVLCEERDRQGLLTGLTAQYVRMRWEGPSDRIGKVETVIPQRAAEGELLA